MQADGVALHAITAEPDHDRVGVKGRLKARDVVLPFPVHSDPEHKLYGTGEEFYVTQKWVGKKECPNPDYNEIEYDMVQPALVVFDKSGKILQKWSWLFFQPRPDPLDATSNIKTPKGEEMLLVMARPLSSDIMPSIREGRAVEIHASISMAALMKAVLAEKKCCSGSCAVM